MLRAGKLLHQSHACIAHGFQSAADVVFLDEGLNSIITSIKVARQIFHRMKAYIVYRKSQWRLLVFLSLIQRV